MLALIKFARLMISPALLLSSCAVLAQTQNPPDELAIIEQIDQPVAIPAGAAISPWRQSLSYDYQINQVTTPGATWRQQLQQVQLNSQYQATWQSNWSAHFSHTLTWSDADTAKVVDSRVREAYLQYRASPALISEFGLINLRYGLAYGYNPNEVLVNYQHNSNRSFDPQDLRETRVGVMALRQQVFLPDWNLALLYLPAFEQTANTLITPNARHQFLLSLSPTQLATKSQLQSQFFLHASSGAERSIGANLSALVNDASIWQLEARWSAATADCAKFSTQLTFLLPHCRQQRETRLRLATGLTYSFSNKLSVLAEYHFDSRAANSQDWALALQSDARLTGAYYASLLQQQQLSTKQAYLVHARWDDFSPHWDMSAYYYQTRAAEQRRFYLQLRYRARQADFNIQMLRAQQLQLPQQTPLSQQNLWQFSWRRYL